MFIFSVSIIISVIAVFYIHVLYIWDGVQQNHPSGVLILSL